MQVGGAPPAPDGDRDQLSGVHQVGQFLGGTQQWNGGAVASQEAVKLLGTNGGGYFNANSAHPFENPTPVSNFFEIFLLLLIPVALTRAFGRLVGSPRQGYAILGAMGLRWLLFATLTLAAEHHGAGPAPELAGGAMEGKETRFGVSGSALFAVALAGTSTGAVSSTGTATSPAGTVGATIPCSTAISRIRRGVVHRVGSMIRPTGTAVTTMKDWSACTPPSPMVSRTTAATPMPTHQNARIRERGSPSRMLDAEMA